MSYLNSFMLVIAIYTSALCATAQASGLKKTSYANETADMKSSSSSPEGGLSAEQSKKLLQDIEVIKAKQLEAQKVLEELDEE